jgi:hypothetical protein
MEFVFAPVMVTWLAIQGKGLSGGGVERRPSITLYRKNVGRETSLAPAPIRVDFFKSRLRGSGFNVSDEDLEAMATALRAAFEGALEEELRTP